MSAYEYLLFGNEFDKPMERREQEYEEKVRQANAGNVRK